MEGADLNTVRELLGHKSIKMILRYAPSFSEPQEAGDQADRPGFW